MRKKAKTPNKTPARKSPDVLLKTSKKRDIELTEQELGRVSGGWELAKWKFSTTTKPE